MTAIMFTGFGNQVRRESGTWWSTRRWWTQIVVWSAITNGLLALMLWVVPQLEALAGGPELTVAKSAAQFAGMAAMLASIGVVVVSQGILIDERRQGVLEWMLSKPLSRGALLSAKFVGHAVAIIAVVVLVPWLGVLAQLSVADGSWWPLGRWLGAVALVGLLAVFHLALVVALSTLTWSRALVVAVPLAGIIGTDLLLAGLPEAIDLLPWSIGRLSGPVLADAVLVSTGPIAVAGALTGVLLVAAGWGLRRTEL